MDFHGASETNMIPIRSGQPSSRHSSLEISGELLIFVKWISLPANNGTGHFIAIACTGNNTSSSVNGGPALMTGPFLPLATALMNVIVQKGALDLDSEQT